MDAPPFPGPPSPLLGPPVPDHSTLVAITGWLCGLGQLLLEASGEEVESAPTPVPLLTVPQRHLSVQAKHERRTGRVLP